MSSVGPSLSIPHLPDPAMALPQTISADMTLIVVIVVIAMLAGGGYMLGRRFGTQDSILDTMAGDDVESRARRLAKIREGLVHWRQGEPDAYLSELVTRVEQSGRLAALFSTEIIDELLAIASQSADDLPKSVRKQAKEIRTELLMLLTHLAWRLSDERKLQIVAGMCKIVAIHPHAAANLVGVATHEPGMWSYISPSLDEVGDRNESVKRFLRESAGPDKPFVQAAGTDYTEELERFNRLCEDYAIGLKTVVTGELSRKIRNEILFAHLAGRPSKRFGWLVANARRTEELYEDGDIQTLIDCTHARVPEVSSLLAQLVLTRARLAVKSDGVYRMIDELAAAARENPRAGDALYGIFKGSEEKEGKDGDILEEVRRRSYLGLVDASKHSFEIIKLMSSRAVPRDLYSQ